MKSTKQILELEKNLKKLENLHASFDYLKITLASPRRVENWSKRILPNYATLGEILRPETINFRTQQPEPNGLFCEKIFGPLKNCKCKCGKYNGFILDKICEDCHVEIIEARVRRYRMGHIHLTCPLAHLWYFRGIPNYLCMLLRIFDSREGTLKERKEKELKISHIENILYFKEGERFLSEISPLHQFSFEASSENELEKFFTTNFQRSEGLNDISFVNEANRMSEVNRKRSYISPNYKINNTLHNTAISQKQKKRRGAEILKAALESINLKMQIQKDRSFLSQLANSLDSPQLFSQTSLFDKTLVRRIRILESFLSTRTNPSWMILTTLPVLPPSLRPLLELESGRLVAADVNEIYRLILTRNQRLWDFIYNYMAPDLIVVQARKLLQESVDSLIDNARVPKERKIILNNKALKSLTEVLEGKQGRFRQTLLGKRVDYSGRSVIVVGPMLRLNQCGIPYEMAKELFQPFLIHELLKTKIKAPSHNTKLAHLIIKRNKPFIWTLLIALTKKYSILLNRAPTLHRFGIQAFDPVLILGQAIHLHPLVCTGFNADFDGDQMAIHLPLYETSQLEIRSMMRPSFHVLSCSNGEVILKPSQDMVIGCYYLTLMIHQNKSPIQKWFSNSNQVLCAFYQKKITLHSPIFIRYSNFQFEISIQQGKLQFLETTKKRENLNMAENRTLVFSKQNPYIENLFLKANNRSEKNTCKDYQKEFVGTVRDEMVESLKNQHQTLNRKQALHKISLNSLTDSTVENGFLFKRSFEIWKKIETNQNKIYFFTSFGVLIGYKITVQNTESYYITDVFLETTPGRLIFSLNYKNSYIGTNT
jgi:DNA-directed RNA polymerase subunit beta'